MSLNLPLLDVRSCLRHTNPPIWLDRARVQAGVTPASRWAASVRDDLAGLHWEVRCEMTCALVRRFVSLLPDFADTTNHWMHNVEEALSFLAAARRPRHQLLEQVLSLTEQRAFTGQARAGTRMWAKQVMRRVLDPDFRGKRLHDADARMRRWWAWIWHDVSDAIGDLLHATNSLEVGCLVMAEWLTEQAPFEMT